MKKIFNRFINRNRLHVYQQLEHSDCGQACIKIIAHYYGIKLSSYDIRNITDANKIGMSALDISQAIRKIGIDSAILKIGKEHLIDMPLPAIIYWNQNHFTVLYKIDKKRNYHIIDPAKGKFKINETEFLNSFLCGGDLGVVILADYNYSKGPITNEYITNKNKRRSLWHFMKVSWIKHKLSYEYILAFTTIGILADILIPFIFQHTIDDGITGRDISLIWLFIFSQLLIFLGGSITNWLAQLKLNKLALSIGIDLLYKYLSRLIDMPMSFFARKVSADLIQKVEDHNRIQNFMLNLPGTLLFSSINLVVFTCLLIYFNSTIFSVFIIGTATSVLWTCSFLRYRKSIDGARSGLMAKNRNNLYELIHGIDEIKANNAHKHRVEIWNNVQQEYNSLSFKSSKVEFYQNGGSSILTQIRDLSITGISACLVVSGEMTIGLMMTISYIVGRLSIPFNSLITSLNSAQDAALSYERIEEITYWEYNDGQHQLTNSINLIEFNDVCFKYPGATNPYVLNNINLTIPDGKTIAFVGESGCGKSTLIKLIIGFYKANLGKIIIDGFPIEDINSNSLSEQIGIVLQNGTIFSDTIKANIALADIEPDVKKIKQILEIVSLNALISKLPLGMNTKVGETGLELSGGEKQRLLIARALYKNPNLLILDEATSSLDAVTEKLIMSRIFELYENKTLIIAAHRLSTIQNADTIFVMKDGHIVENGNHSSLLAKKGEYSKLVHNQMKAHDKVN